MIYFIYLIVVMIRIITIKYIRNSVFEISTQDLNIRSQMDSLQKTKSSFQGSNNTEATLQILLSSHRAKAFSAFKFSLNVKSFFTFDF